MYEKVGEGKQIQEKLPRKKRRFLEEKTSQKEGGEDARLRSP